MTELGVSAVDLTTVTQLENATNDAEEKAENLETIKKGEGTEESSEKAGVIAASNKTSAEIQEEIDALKEEIAANNKKMTSIEEEIMYLTEKVKKNMKEAKELQEKAIDKHQEEAEKAVEENIARYVEANKDGGEGMSKEELELNISNSIPNAPDLAKALAKFVTASRELAEIDMLLNNLNDVVIDTDGIEIDLKDKNNQYEEAVKQEEAAKCCDPIGFMKNGARYDFIVDDGSFDSTSDFLGANNQWVEMQALDSDGDNVINASELKEAGIKLVKTENGKKEVVDIADEFSEDFTIDLSSYQQGGSYNGISTNDSDNDGILDQQLLGTYRIHIGDEEIDGYNTLDDVDYLTSEYGIGTGNENYSSELEGHKNFFSEYSETSQKLKTELRQDLISFGISENAINKIDKLAKEEAQADANFFMKKIEAENKEQQEAQEVQEENNENPLGLNPEQQKLLEKGIPENVIKEGDDAIMKFAQENNIDLEK